MGGNAKRKGMYWICRVAFLVYVVVLIYLLFFCDRYGRTEQFETIKYNLVPFQEIRRYIMNWQYFTVELFIANIAGNICLFVPYGALLFVWFGRPVGFLEVTLSSFGLSLIIELIQLVTRVGVCDVDDMILNTVGGMLGYFVYLLTRTIHRRLVNVRRKEKL